jgi:DhnA family fructose-bisphosphate aldolase class Ia
MQAGKLHRWNRIFQRDGNSLILAMDHAAGGGALPGLEDPAETIARCVDAGVDAIMTTYGTAKTFQKEIRGRGLILRIDTGKELEYSVEDALRIGADSIITMGWVHEGLEDNDHLTYLADTAVACDKWGMPYLAEMIPYEHIPYFRAKLDYEPESSLEDAVVRCCRMGAELGADYIKTIYSGSVDAFSKAVQGSFIPLLILGGKFVAGKEREVLQNVYDSLQAGGHGIVMGRNIWANPEPQKIVAALNVLIHEQGSVEEAMKIIQ